MKRQTYILLIGLLAGVLFTAEAHAQHTEHDVLTLVSAVCEEESFPIDPEDRALQCDCSPEALRKAAQVLENGYLRLNTVGCYNGPDREFPEHFELVAAHFSFGDGNKPLLVGTASMHSASGLERQMLRVYALTATGAVRNVTEEHFPDMLVASDFYDGRAPKGAIIEYVLPRNGSGTEIVAKLWDPATGKAREVGRYRYNTGSGVFSLQ